MTPRELMAGIAASSGSFRAMCLLLVAAFLLGGGARGDIQSLVVLRPLAVLLLFYGLYRIDRTQIAANRFVLGCAALSVALLVLHLIPLPPAMWQALPGRDLIVRIDAAAGIGPVWRPLSMVPDATLNALFAAMVPCAALVLGVQLDPRERGWLIVPVLLLGGLSAALGLAQLSGPPGGPLHFYRVTNDDAAVGLFANRNHQAMLLAMLIPVLGHWAAHSSRRSLLALPLSAALLLLILVTGSRAGLVLALCALIFLPLIVPGMVRGAGRFAARTLRTRGGPWVLAGLATFALLVALLLAYAVWQGRGLALERLIASSPGEDMRFQILPTLFGMIAFYFPLGSGLGSFERVFQVHEPDSLLQPGYANHVHNDWLELALTGGLPAMLLLGAVIMVFAIRARRILASTDNSQLPRLGMAVIVLSAIASIGDYPLRVPSLGCFFVVGVIWMSCSLSKNPSSRLTS